jgi:type IV secretory pathway VirJ component
MNARTLFPEPVPVAAPVDLAAAVAPRPRRWPLLVLLLLLLGLAAYRPVKVALRTVHIVGPLFHPIPATGPHHDIALLFLSGDAGFNRGSGPEITARLAKAGYPVLGVDSLHFFATPRNAADDGALVTGGARALLRWTGAKRFVVVGESFGADMTPSGVERMPPALRRRLAGVVLLVPTRTINFHVSLAEWLGWSRPDADAATVARRIGPVPMLCIRGAQETQSLCPELAMPMVRQAVLPGNHYLDHDYDRTAALIARGIEGMTGRR